MSIYQESMALAQSFTFCPNAFRADMYRGCSYGCKYCFANMQIFNQQKRGEADMDKVRRKFYIALETDKPRKDILIELIRNRVPLHCGGMSDPFQYREWETGLTYQLIEISNKYAYPIVFSTKTSFMPTRYLDILNPKIHAFQSSIMGWSDKYIRMWEEYTDTAGQRVKFVKRMRDDGFWHSIRVQPIIDIEEVLNLLKNAFSITTPSYITVEHFKLINDNVKALEAYKKLVDNKQDFTYTSSKKLEVKKSIKLKNIERIKELANMYGVSVGVGDNDLHELTQGRNCCGIDSAGEAFENYLKYNLTYLSTGKVENDLFIPQCNCRKHINNQKFGNHIDYKEYVDTYIAQYNLKQGCKPSLF